MKSARNAVSPFLTKDGSEIRELMHPSAHGNQRQSLAEATVQPGGRTVVHLHRVTEEIYHFLRGRGRMRRGDETFDVAAGDTVAIPPGVAHGLINPHDEPLVLLCACSPAYAHEDTELLE